MTDRFNRCALLILFFAIILSAASAVADEQDLLLKLNAQQKIIDLQNQRIERLERALEEIMRLPEDIRETNAAATNNGPPEASRPAIVSETPSQGASSIPAGSAGEIPAAEDPFAGQSAPKKGYNPEQSFFGPLPRFTSPTGYSFGFSGVFQYDVAGYSQSGQDASAAVPDFRDGSRVRRGIMALTGIFPKDWIWAFVYDFADTNDSVIDGLRSALAVYRGFEPWWVILGQQNNGIGLDASNFSSHRVFMEEAMPAGAFAFAPGSPLVGVSTLYRQNNKYIRLGLMGDAAKQPNSVSDGATGDEAYGLHGRFAWAPVAERTKALHVGISSYWRKPDATGFSSDPEITLDSTKLIDTGAIANADDYYFVGLEGALVRGSFSAQAEYGVVNIGRTNNQIGEPAFQDLGFNGYYLQTSYFLTGESRNYYPRFAAFWRVDPKNDFSLEAGTWGAWEVGLRYSFLDLDDGAENLSGGGVRGGVAENYTLGLNWYLNPFVRTQLNYVHSNVENLGDNGVQEGDVVHILGTRIQVEW